MGDTPYFAPNLRTKIERARFGLRLVLQEQIKHHNGPKVNQIKKETFP
jgi:hypothetical protein